MNGEAMITAGMIAEEVLRERAITLQARRVEVIKTEDGMIGVATEMMIAVATMTTGAEARMITGEARAGATTVTGSEMTAETGTVVVVIKEAEVAVEIASEGMIS